MRVLLLVSLFLIRYTYCQDNAVENPEQGSMLQFEFRTDIGNPRLPGSSFFNKDEQSYTLKGSGYNIWFARDEFFFLYN